MHNLGKQKKKDISTIQLTSLIDKYLSVSTIKPNKTFTGYEPAAISNLSLDI
jgi:hypothetical protein